MASPQREAEKASETLSRSPSRAACRRFLTLFFVLVLAVAAVLRLASLDNRLVHCDEANQAVMFGRLLERGEYTYDPREHHGPALNYLTLPVAWLSGVRNLTEVTEIHLRLLPAIFGIILVGLVWLIRNELGRGAAFWAALLAAVSPAMVFYSRYYIMEMLLVCFTFGAMVSLWRYVRAVRADLAEEGEGHGRPWLRQGFWLVSLGLCIGMMHASKETCVIALFAMALAAGLTIRELRQIGLKRLGVAGLVVFLSAAAVSVLFFSSFSSHWQGVVDSVAAYGQYFHRASGEGSAGPHDHPWYHYLRILFWWQSEDGPVWTELSIAVLAVAGLVATVAGKWLGRTNVAMARFVGIYALVMTVVYSAMAYKTPWCVLGFLHGMILLAGIGAAVLVRTVPGYILKGVVIALLIAATGHLAWQGYRASFVACNDPSTSYVHTPTSAELLLLADRVKQLATVRLDDGLVDVEVIAPDDDYWPLPWYLRDLASPFEQHEDSGVGQVGYFRAVRKKSTPPLIVIRPELTPALARKFFDPAAPSKYFYYKDQERQLRRNVFLQVYVREDLWRAYQAALAEQPPPEEALPRGNE